MTRNLKILAVAAFGVMALSAMLASAASAQKGVLTAGKTSPLTHTSTAIHAVQYGAVTDNSFTAFGSSLHCENAGTSFTGTAGGTDTSISIAPSYKDCYQIAAEDKVGLPVTVTMNGCTFKFNQPTVVAGTSDTTWTGTVDIVCPEKPIEVHVYSSGEPTKHSNISICTQTIPAQKNIGTIEYHNIAGTPDDITVTVGAINITVIRHGLCGSSEEKNAKYTGKLTLTSTNDDLWFSTQ